MSVAFQYRKGVILLGMGQSNERGVMSAPQVSRFGPFNADPILPSTSTGVGSYWVRVAERLAAERRIAARMRNGAVGSTSWLSEHAGYTGTIGLDAVALAPEDDGFDPNDILSDAWASIAGIGGASERWAIMAGTGQRDDTLGVLPSEYKTGLEQCCRYFLTQDPAMRFLLGFTVWKASMTLDEQDRYLGYARVAWELVDELGAEYPAQFWRGPRGTDLWAYGEAPLADSVHLDDAGHLAMGDAIFDALVATGQF